MRQRAFITGAASGIGRATARLFAARGWTVGLADRDGSSLALLADELGPEASMAFCCDVTDADALARALESFCGGADGRLELLVGPFEEMPPSAHREMIAVNARGVVEALLAAFPMLRAAQGRVVNLSSASASYGSPDFATYSASKMFVRGLSEALDVEWRRHGIRIACVMPAFVDTPMIAGWHSVSMQKLGVQLSAEHLAEIVWKAAHSRRLMWHVGWRYRLLRLVVEPLPRAFKRAMMRWVSGYPGAA